MSTAQAALIYCPVPDVETARGIAKQMLAEHLIACANIIPQVESVFVWEGKTGTAAEAAMLLKTTAARLDQAINRLGALHPYDTPAIVGTLCNATHPATLEWLAQQTE